MERKAVLSLLFIGALFLAGCTGASFNSTTSSAVTAVTVSCAPSTLQPGQTSQCSVSISGAGNYSHAVTWTVASGSISSTGLYTAPSTPPADGVVAIQATSAQNTAKSGTAMVAVAATAAPITVS